MGFGTDHTNVVQHEESGPAPSSMEWSQPMPAAFVCSGKADVVVLGRSQVCVLDRMVMEDADDGVSWVACADAALAARGWTRLGDWQVAPALTPATAKMGITEHAYAAPVIRTKTRNGRRTVSDGDPFVGN